MARAFRVFCAVLLSVLVVGFGSTPALAQTEPRGAVPRGLTTDGVGCLAPSGGRATGSAPVLAGVPWFAGGLARARVEVRTVSGSTNLRSWLSEPVSTGVEASWQVDPPLAGGAHQWRMRSEHPDGTALAGWSGWCEFTVDASLGVEPPAEPTDDLECPVEVSGGEPLVAADESAALLLARACDAPAEALSERDFGSRVLARPDGVLVAEQFMQPQWAQDADGEWVEVDPSFEVGDDGTIATVAAVSTIEVSAGGIGALVTATDPDGGLVSLSWPEPLPAPVVEGNTVTYPEVLDGVDLQVSAGVDGFSYVLVVKSAAAAAGPELASVSVEIDAEGLTVGQDATGSVVATDTAGEVVFSAPAAYIWDSSTPPDGAGLQQVEDGSGDDGDVPPGQFTQMPLELSGGSLTVEPDQALLSDPETVFPVVIDPPFSGKRMHWASVHQQQPGRGWTDDSRWPREGGMRVGNLQWWPGYPCGDACGLWRSAIRFNTSGLAGRQIVSASVKAVQTHTSGCGSYGLQLWHVDAFTSGVSFNGLSSKWNGLLQTQNIDSSNRTGGCSQTQPYGVTFGGSSMRSLVQQVANAGGSSVSFGFRSSDEVAKQAYRRIAVDGVKLEVEYNRPAEVPTSLNTDGHGCATSGPGPWVTTQRPTLSGKPRDPDGRVGAHVQVRKIGSSATYHSWQSATNRAHNTVVNHRISSDKNLPSGSYRWRMRSLDSHPQGTDSAWREWCYFRVDVTSPTVPKVELVGGPPVAGQPVTLRFTASDAHSGLGGFDYGVNEEVKRTSIASSGTATVTFTAPSGGGRMWIYVWARDSAGNLSDRAVFDFFAARMVEATPAAAWRLDGDALDDTGQGHELHLGGGVAWQSSGPDQWLDFDGTGCVGTAGPVVRTDAEYTVTAWTRLDDLTTHHQILGQAGAVKSGFYLRYDASTSRWLLALASADVADPGWAAVRSSQPAVAGVWTHLAARVDPPAGHMQLYVDGQLSGEAAIPFTNWHANGPAFLGCAAAQTGEPWYPYRGAIHHVGVWQGLLTPAQIQAAYASELPAGVTGDWRLRATGADASAHGRALALPTTGVSWVEDQFGRQQSAMRLAGTSWAESAGPIVRTDQSYSVSAWARLDSKEHNQTAVSQAGGQVAGFHLGYLQATDRWSLTAIAEDAVGSTQHKARSTTAPQVGQWYHLVGVYDNVAGRLRLYVNGALHGDVAAPASPWRAEGPLLVGAAGTTAGARGNRLAGTVSDVTTWRGALTAEQVAEVYGGNPAAQLVARWDLDGSGADAVGAHGLTLSGTEGVDYDWVEDRTCFPWSALGLRLSGHGYARTTGPVLATNESYTISAWVKVDAVTGAWQTFLAQRGTIRAAYYLQVTPTGGWRFSLAEQDSSSSGFAGVETAASSVEVGVWTHVAGVFDLPKREARLYVNGELVGTGSGPASPWHADDHLIIGAGSVTEAGTIYQPFGGSVDSVVAWSSTLDPDRIASLGRPVLGGGGC